MQMHLLELVVAILHSIAAQNVRIHQVLFDKFHCERDFGLADEFCCTQVWQEDAKHSTHRCAHR